MAALELGCDIVLVGTLQEEAKLKTSACKTPEQEIVVRTAAGILKEELTPLLTLLLKRRPFFVEEKIICVVCWCCYFFDQVTVIAL